MVNYVLDSTRCLTGIQCHHKGSTSGTCSRNGACSCKSYYGGRRCQDFKPTDCSVLDKTHYGDGVYTIYPNGGASFKVYCDMKTDGGGWTVFQRRVDGAVDFYRKWSEYEGGFGDVKHEFWLGNANLHRLTSMGNTELRIDVINFNRKRGYAKYSSFLVKNAYQQYRLRVSGYSGNAGDSLTYHNGWRFSTRDRDYDGLHINCAAKYKAGWWYNECLWSNLNGIFNIRGENGVSWYHLDNQYGTIWRSKMMLRRK
ncbi:fibrinogen-like protein A [Mytilus californianus]|uniref:fibrinogen-like protein A n=1 Tax=Mytilus californianus TaxID=6549 RepID=UPI0022467F4B|nr:fibrinogen-like protein A [Mytilus californianus]